MRVRVATAYDEQPVLDVLRADGEVTGRQPSRARLAAVRATLRARTTLTLVAERNGAVVGVLVAELGRADDGAGAVQPGLLHVPVLCVCPPSRRQGVGRALVRGLLARFEHVSTWSPDDATTTLLASEGFTRTGRTAEVRGRSAEHLVHRPA